MVHLYYLVSRMALPNKLGSTVPASDSPGAVFEAQRPQGGSPQHQILGATGGQPDPARGENAAVDSPKELC